METEATERVSAIVGWAHPLKGGQLDHVEVGTAVDLPSNQAESPGAGQGSTFTVKFPRSPVTAQPAHGRVDAPDLTGIRVLIVEDDDDVRALVAEVLQGQGARVDVVASARTGGRLRARRAGFPMQLPKPVQPAERITVVASLATCPD